MNKIKSVLFVASILLALVFTFSCSGGDDVDSNAQLSSSSQRKASSSSGSGSVAYMLTCAAVPSSGIAGTTISPPTVTCNGTAVSSGLNWTNAPNWSNPAIGTYSGVSVSASFGDCKGKTATCSGILTVNAAPSVDQLTCTGMPTTGAVGTAITQPTVRCGTNIVTTGITWANAPAWADPEADTYSVTVTANCGGSSKTANCGKLAIASVLTCSKVAPSGTAGTAITAPAVTCNGKTISDDIDWIGAPDWSNPMAGTYSGISASTNYGDCKGKTATCSGTLTVASVLTCAAVPSTGFVGTTITPPTVTCNGTAVGSGLNWTKAPNWNNPVIGTYSGMSVSASSGDCKGKTATCGGTLTVSAAPSADELTCTGMPATGIAGTAITQPTVRCGINAPTTSIIWANAPNWSNPAAATYNVLARARCEGSSTKEASCGTLTVTSVLSCATLPSTGTVGTAITAPKVTCNGTAVSSGLNWTDAPTWSNPTAGTYSGVSVAASSGDCSGLSATCSGTLAVASVLTCAKVPTSGTAGTAITAPTVTCNGTAVSSGLSWTSAPNWTTPVAGTYSGVSVAASSGDCSGKSANCSGTLTVANPITYTLNCANVPATGTAGTAITAPAVTCTSSNGTSTSVSSGLSWTDAPTWSNPTAGTYSGVSVATSTGNCSGKTATCNGTLTVATPATYTLTCADVPSTGTAGTAITAPAVTCNGSNGTSTLVSSGLSWTSAPTWSNPVVGTYSSVSVKASSGDCSGKTATCNGTLAVSAAPTLCANTVEYNPATENCCGSNKYIIASQFCSSNVIYEKCGNTVYNPSTHFCDGSILLNKCGGNTYTLSTQFCSENIVYDYGKCKEQNYRPTNQRCENNVVETKCGTNWYNATNTNLRCQNNIIETKCGSSWYNAAAQSLSCSNGKLSITDSRDGQTYKIVTIGTQVWMAENLNYNATDTRCYNDNTGGDSYGYCTTYGRLYNWATAMALPSSCNSSSCVSQVGTKHRGICPSGWHIPSNADWNVLMKYVNPSCSDNSICDGAGTKLKATSGWYSGNGTDNYGFAALPGGYGSSGSFGSAGGSGSWWTATEREGAASYAYLRYIHYTNSEHVDYDYHGKNYLYSVRCVLD